MKGTPLKHAPSELWYEKCGIYFKPNDEYKLIYVQRDTPPHTHMDFYEFTFITKGSFSVYYKDEKKTYRKNTLMFWKCGETHAIYPEETSSTHCSFLVPAKKFEQMCASHHPDAPELLTTSYAECYLSPEKATYLAALGTKALTCNKDAHEYFQLFLHIMLFHIFFEKREIFDNKNLDLDGYVTDIIAKFETPDCLSAPIADIYNLYPIHKAALIQHFKERTGNTIVEYRNVKRMERAAVLLSVQKLPVTQVASLVGITSLSYFSKKFYEFFGVHPNEYSSKYYQFPPTIPQDVPEGHDC